MKLFKEIWRNGKSYRDEKGVTVVEYALMLALVAIAVALATPNIASAVINVFSKASSVMAK